MCRKSQKDDIDFCSSKLKVIKRTGEEIDYDREKIKNAILKASKAVQSVISSKKLEKLIDEIEIKIKASCNREKVHVEHIQDIVEEQLMLDMLTDVVKAYIIYRQKHFQQRLATQKLMKQFDGLLFVDSEGIDLKRENANINTNAPMGIMLKIGTETMKVYANDFVMPEKFTTADKEGWIHIHDKDFGFITFNCLQIDLPKILKQGFSTGHGYIREPQSIRSASALAAICLQSSQNDCFGGQSLNGFDYAMAEYVRKTFKKTFIRELKTFTSYCDDVSNVSINPLTIDFSKCRYTANRDSSVLQYIIDWFDSYEINRKKICQLYDIVCSEIEDETWQAMEALVFNFNSLHSRAGSQVN